MKKELINWEDFQKIEMRTGTIVEVMPFPEARKPAYKLTIDFGPFGIKRSSAQITELYQQEDLLNLQIVAVVNFPPKQIANFISECLVVGSVDEQGKVTLLHPGKKTDNGLIIA